MMIGASAAIIVFAFVWDARAQQKFDEAMDFLLLWTLFKFSSIFHLISDDDFWRFSLIKHTIFKKRFYSYSHKIFPSFL